MISLVKMPLKLSIVTKGVTLRLWAITRTPDPCCCLLAGPQVTDGSAGLKTWRVTANILNKMLWVTKEGLPTCSWLERGDSNSPPSKASMLRNVKPWQQDDLCGPDKSDSGYGELAGCCERRNKPRVAKSARNYYSVLEFIGFSRKNLMYWFICIGTARWFQPNTASKIITFIEYFPLISARSARENLVYTPSKRNKNEFVACVYLCFRPFQIWNK